MNKRRVSVVVTILNEAKSLTHLLESLFSQSLQADEIIIIDGGSQDGSWEILERSKTDHSNLIAIKDTSCSLLYSHGPIARGRNRAISQTSNEIIACADAGCVYESDWLFQITAPLLRDEADYCIGRSCIDKDWISTWNVSCAPFVGFDLPGTHMPKSPTGTARSFAMTKQVWENLEGYPENSLAGEDTAFLRKARGKYREIFIPSGCAYYRHSFSLLTGLQRIARYANADGLLRQSQYRFVFMLARIFLCSSALSVILWSKIPFLLFLVLEIIYALRYDGVGMLLDGYIHYIPSRVFFSLVVPWIFVWSYMEGWILGKNQINEQNRQ